MCTLEVYNNDILLVSQEVTADKCDTIKVDVHGEVFLTDKDSRKPGEARAIDSLLSTIRSLEKQVATKDREIASLTKRLYDTGAIALKVIAERGL